jgi:DNA-directed RNA polymerase specialized sigma24 family protein
MSTSDQHDRTRETDQDEQQRHFARWLDSLPRLTRLVFLLHSVDELPYDKVAWRGGISVDEVTLRIANAIVALHCLRDGRVSIIRRLRLWLLPWRFTWARCRMAWWDRRLGL